MTAASSGTERRRRPSRVPDGVLDARAEIAAFETIVSACPASVSGDRHPVAPGLAQRLATHPRLRSRSLARLREHVGDLRAFADAVTLRGAPPPGDVSAEVLAGLLFHIGSLGPALERRTLGTLEAACGAAATSFALRHAALSPSRPADLDLKGPGLADLIAAAGRDILAMDWGRAFGPASHWLATPTSSDPVPLLSGQAVAAIAAAVASHVLGKGGPAAAGGPAASGGPDAAA